MKLKVLISTFNYEPIYPSDLVGYDHIIEYEAKNPFPATEEYTREDMIGDMQHTHRGGILTFHGTTEDQESWIEEMLNELI